MQQLGIFNQETELSVVITYLLSEACRHAKTVLFFLQFLLPFSFEIFNKLYGPN